MCQYVGPTNFMYFFAVYICDIDATRATKNLSVFLIILLSVNNLSGAVSQNAMQILANRCSSAKMHSSFCTQNHSTQYGTKLRSSKNCYAKLWTLTYSLVNIIIFYKGQRETFNWKKRTLKPLEGLPKASITDKSKILGQFALLPGGIWLIGPQ